jgi:hypothetical protein
MKHLNFFNLMFAAVAMFACFQSNVLAQTVNKPQVVLLVSLDPAFYPKGLAAILHNYKKYPEKLESIFRGSFDDSVYDIQVIQNATADDLYRVLHSPTTAGVFWVSHEAPISWNVTPGVQIDPLLVDEHEADVKSIFRDINPNVRWVSIVACQSNLVVNWLKSQMQNDPIVSHSSAELQGFDTTIDAKKGLRQAIDQSQDVLSAPAPSAPCLTERGVRITLTRTLSAANASGSVFFPAMTIENNGEIVGTFPEANIDAGQVQTAQATVYLDPSVLSITVNSGFDPGLVEVAFSLGSFTVSAASPLATWKVFAKPDGTPFGVTDEVLFFNGDATAVTSESYQPFSCAL